MSSVLDAFGAATRDWFVGAFRAPTPAQEGAWAAIAKGQHALVVAPTGSGKTLASFLWAIDRLANRPADTPRGTRVLYISPLKALGVDVERNLRSPLVGVTQTAKRLGQAPPRITVGVRSGDTSQADRRALAKDPPEILITTPESLFLMLTSAARETLASVDTVIVDEVHAVAATKRGSHLALSLERLDAMLERPAQRIGLSATVKPVEEVARFLGGRAPVTVVAPKAQKTFDLTVVVPVEDMSDPDLGSGWPEEGAGEPHEGSAAQDVFDPDDPMPQRTGSMWPYVESAITDLVLEHRSSIVFTNSRRQAERLTARLNEEYQERVEAQEAREAVGAEAPALASALAGRGVPAPAAIMAASGSTRGATEVLARAHHGSVSKEQRGLIEDDLKSGRLRCVVATSSLELGIDMGAVDLVVQVGAPPSVASGLQRIGRAGHQVGEISTGVVFPVHQADLIHAAVATDRMLRGEIESLRVPANPLDVLAQQTVAACAIDELEVEAWFDTVRRSAPFAALPRSAYEAVLDLLAGRYPSDEFAELRPRIVWDRDAGTITGRPGAQRLAVTSGGTIPDRGLFGVFLVSGGEGGGNRVGELDEEMVYESRVGDVFSLGATSWRIQEITHDRVLVLPAFGEPGRVPFWKGDGLGRPAELGRAVGAFQRTLAAAKDEEASTLAERIGLDRRATANLLRFVRDQADATGAVPSDRTLVLERFRDELGDWRIVLHSPYGMQVHAPWALAVSARLAERFGIENGAMAADDGIVLRVPDTDAEPPGADLFLFEPDELDQIVTDRGHVLRDLRLPLPRVRRPRPAAPALQPGEALPALAAAAAGQPAARRREEVPDVPDHLRDDPRGAAGRLRPALAEGPGGRAGGAGRPRGRGRDADRFPVRQEPALQLRRRVPLRGRQPARGAEGAGARPRLDAAVRAARPGRAARAPGPRGRGVDRAGAAARRRRPPAVRGGRRGRPPPPARPAHHRRARRPAARRGDPRDGGAGRGARRRARRDAPRHRGVLGR